MYLNLLIQIGISKDALHGALLVHADRRCLHGWLAVLTEAGWQHGLQSMLPVQSASTLRPHQPARAQA